MSKIESESTLIFIYANLPFSFSYSNLNQLQVLMLLGQVNLDEIEVMSSHLLELHLEPGSETVISQSQWSSLISFPALLTFDCSNCDLTDLSSLEITLENELTSLSITFIPPISSNIIIHDNTGHLLSLTLNQIPNSEVVIEKADSLKFLSITRFSSPPAFDTISSLETLILGGPYTIDSTFPESISTLMNLKRFELKGMEMASGSLDSLLCPFLRGNLSELSLYVSDQSERLELPSCARESTKLTKLSMIPQSPTQMDLNILFPKLPSSLRHLEIDTSESEADVKPQMDEKWFLNISLISFLKINSALSGSLPHQLFDALPSLVDLELSYNDLEGTIPWYGEAYSNIKSMIIQRSPSLSHWPGILLRDHQQLNNLPLKTLSLAFNNLFTIPDDADWALFPNLKLVDLSFNPSLSGPIPLFWANHPSLEMFDASFCAFQGNLPTPIHSPRMHSLKLESNALCGSLPSFQSLHVLHTLSLSHNAISGAIPDQWADLLKITSELLMEDMEIEGPFPSHWFASHGLTLVNLQFSHNPFLQGPVFNMSSLREEAHVGLLNTSINLCSLSPSLNSQILSCIVDSVCGCENEWLLCNGASCFEEPSSTAPSPPTPQEESPPFTLGPEMTHGTPIFKRNDDKADYDHHLRSDSDLSNHEILKSLQKRREIASGLKNDGKVARPRDEKFQYVQVKKRGGVCVDPPPRVSPDLTFPSPPQISIGCIGTIPPGFTCVGGLLVANQSLTIPGSLDLPPNVGTVTINGNLTIDDAIVFDGLGSQLDIKGCLLEPNSDPSNLEIIISLPSPTKTNPVILVQQNSSCPYDLNDIKVTVKQAKSCKRSVLKKDGTTPSSLVVAFDLDASKCNVKWIILGSVLGGVLVIGVVITVLVVTFNEKARHLVRPFSKARS
jgi:hypothetical protein